jgi:hypothetical protein
MTLLLSKVKNHPVQNFSSTPFIQATKKSCHFQGKIQEAVSETKNGKAN